MVRSCTEMVQRVFVAQQKVLEELIALVFCTHFPHELYFLGVGKIFFKKVPISIWELRKSRGGLNFSKMSQSQLFCNYFAILPL